MKYSSFKRKSISHYSSGGSRRIAKNRKGSMVSDYGRSGTVSRVPGVGEFLFDMYTAPTRYTLEGMQSLGNFVADQLSQYGSRAVSSARLALEDHFGVPISEVPSTIGAGAIAVIGQQLAAGVSLQQAIRSGVQFASDAGRSGMNAAVGAVRTAFNRGQQRG